MTEPSALSPTGDGRTCDLCAGKCRGHPLSGRPDDWAPEPGSRAYEAEPHPMTAPTPEEIARRLSDKQRQGQA